MRQITVERSVTNMSALDVELRAALGDDYLGLNVSVGLVDIYLLDTTTPEHLLQAEQLVVNHDPFVLTPKQQEEQTREQLLEDFRTADALDLSAYDGATAEVQTLAQKIAWLELEIRELRGL
jgi:hypothetical protein